MKRACFDANGFLLWMARGDFEVPAGATIMEVADDLLPNDICLSKGCVVNRTPMTVFVDRTVVASDRADKFTVTGLPTSCWIEVNGVRSQVAGGSKTISVSAPGAISIRLVGVYRCSPVMVRAAPGAALLDEVRAIRNTMLTQCDYTQAADVPVPIAARKVAWAAYRQALREFPQKQPTATVDTVKWPTLPS